MNKITINWKDIVAVILGVAIVKMALYYYPFISPYLDECAYNFVANNFRSQTVMQLKKKNEINKNSTNIYYIGRSSCPDCRENIIHVKRLLKISENTFNIPTYYVRLKDVISVNERKYLDSIGVDEIPTIVRSKNGKITQFKYRDINAKNYIEKFKKFTRD